MAADTFTNSLGMILMGPGNDPTTWGQNINNLVTTLLEASIAGATKLVGQTGGTVVLTPAQTLNRIIDVRGTLSSDLTLVVYSGIFNPPPKTWVFYNGCTLNAFKVFIKTSAQTLNIMPIPLGVSRGCCTARIGNLSKVLVG